MASMTAEMKAQLMKAEADRIMMEDEEYESGEANREDGIEQSWGQESPEMDLWSSFLAAIGKDAKYNFGKGGYGGQ